MSIPLFNGSVKLNKSSHYNEKSLERAISQSLTRIMGETYIDTLVDRNFFLLTSPLSYDIIEFPRDSYRNRDTRFGFGYLGNGRTPNRGPSLGR